MKILSICSEGINTRDWSKGTRAGSSRTHSQIEETEYSMQNMKEM